LPGESKKEAKTMSLLTVVVVLIVVGILLWCVNTYIPMDAKIKTILNVVVVIVVVVWLLTDVFGLLPAINSIRIGR
jgi:preprotein translocase subunit SecE